MTPGNPIILDGKALAMELRAEMAKQMERLRQHGITPGLAVVLVGDDPASAIYVRQKEKGCGEMGINSLTWRLPAATTKEELDVLIADLNSRPDVHGILVQLPLPVHLPAPAILDLIDPAKDVDGFHPVSLGRLISGREGFLPCTPHGIIKLLKRHRIVIEGKDAVIVGRSLIVGKPMGMLLLAENATVTLCHSRTADLAAHTRRADILVAAVGRENTITGTMVKEGAVVVDVGSNRDSAGKLVGDVDFAAAATRVSAITPVPGGVGPMTITMLLHNTILAAERHREKTP